MTGPWLCMMAACALLWGAGCGEDKEAAMDTSGVDRVIEQAHLALEKIVNGDSEEYTRLFSERDDISLGNPFGPFVKGRQKVVETVANAATRYQDGEVVGFDLINKHVTPDLALLVEVERFRAKVGGSAEAVTIAVRTTQVFRPEGETWKMIHRHTDPITTPQSSESIIPK